jgi:hypothetical protein
VQGNFRFVSSALIGCSMSAARSNTTYTARAANWRLFSIQGEDSSSTAFRD